MVVTKQIIISDNNNNNTSAFSTLVASTSTIAKPVLVESAAKQDIVAHTGVDYPRLLRNISQASRHNDLSAYHPHLSPASAAFYHRSSLQVSFITQTHATACTRGAATSLNWAWNQAVMLGVYLVLAYGGLKCGSPNKLVVPCHKLSSAGRRAFSVIAPSVCNS